MSTTSAIGSAVRLATAGAAVATAAYAALTAVSWWRYGRAAHRRSRQQGDPLLDQFMPAYDVVERHQIGVAAQPEIVMATACEQDLLRVPLVRAIFKAREIVMRADAPVEPLPRGLLATTRALGWGVLAHVPGREIVMGAVTKPWEANVTFRAVPPGEFAAFAQPGFVKIVWTLRADPVGAGASVFRTETRAVATDSYARERFRRYWSFVSPGIALIRRLSLQPLKREAERRARAVPEAATERSC